MPSTELDCASPCSYLSFSEENIYLFPNDNQDNEGDDHNHQQDQDCSCHCEFRTQRWRRKRHGEEFAQTCQSAGRRGGCAWAGTLTPLVEKQEAAWLILGTGNSISPSPTLMKPVQSLPLAEKGTKFNQLRAGAQNCAKCHTSSKGAAALTF